MIVLVLVMPGYEQARVSISMRYWEDVDLGVAKKRLPEFIGRPVVGSEKGLNGTYFLSSSVPGSTDTPEWVFKPRSQEALNGEHALKAGAIRGTACLKEVAAFFLDHDGFAGVPETRAMMVDVKLDGSRLIDFGSLQRFLPHDGSCEEYGSSLFETDNIHRIALLDLRIGNCDRHEGNILVTRDHDCIRAVPIDHGYCLPSWRDLSDLYFCWSSWRQASLPLSNDTKGYIFAQNALLDVMNLLDIGIDNESAVTYILCSFFVQRAVAADLTLAQIACLMQRSTENNNSESSQFELLVKDAASKTGFESFHFTSCGDWSLPIVGDFFKQFLISSCLYLAAYSLN